MQNTPRVKAVLFWLGLNYSQLFFFFCSVHETILISVCHRRKPTKDNTVTKLIWACRSFNWHISIERLSNKMSNLRIPGWIWLALGLFFNREYDLGSKMKSSYKKQPLTRHYVTNLMVKSVGLRVLFWLFRLGLTLNLPDTKKGQLEMMKGNGGRVIPLHCSAPRMKYGCESDS